MTKATSRPDRTASDAAIRGRPPAPPRELVERFQRREPEALEAFFDLYFERVYGAIYRMVGDRQATEDLTQEVFLKVYRAAHRIDPARDPAAWIIAIAANTCRDLWRSAAQRMARNSGPLDDEASRRLPNPAPGPESELIARERERLVRDAIADLPAPLRMAVVLHVYEGLGHDQVAALTGIRGTAARKRYSRALRAVADRLRGAVEP